MTLTTTLVETSDKPQEVLTSMTSTNEVGSEVRIILAAKSPKSVYVDFGDGKLKECRLEMDILH